MKLPAIFLQSIDHKACWLVGFELRLNRRTTVEGGNQTDNQRPHVSEDNAHVAAIKVVDTTRDAKDVVALGLVDDVVRHGYDRHDHAEENLHEVIAPALLFARNQGGPSGVQHQGERAEDADQGSRNGHIAGRHELDFNIAQAVSIPPGLDVVVGPYRGVDNIEEVKQDEPAHQAGGRDIAVLRVQDQWDDAQQETDRRQTDQSRALRKDLPGRHRENVEGGSKTELDRNLVPRSDSPRFTTTLGMK